MLKCTLTGQSEGGLSSDIAKAEAAQAEAKAAQAKAEATFTKAETAQAEAEAGRRLQEISKRLYVAGRIDEYFAALEDADLMQSLLDEFSQAE